MDKVPLFKSPVGDDEADAVRDVLRSGWITSGPKVAEFEQAFADYIGAPYAVAVNSCSAALHLACEAIGVRGGEVIVPAITFAASALAPEWAGARVVFADVDEETLCLDWEDVDRKMTGQTETIITVHLGGRPGNVPDDFFTRFYVIEDCAECAGGETKAGKLGTLEDIGCFSFEAKKNITTGDGGMLVCHDEDIYNLVRKMRWFGISEDTWQRSDDAGYAWDYDIIAEGGCKYNMTDIDAAIGLMQLRKLDALNAARLELCHTYRRELADLEWLWLPAILGSAPWLFQVRVPDRAAFMRYLAERGVQTGVHFKPLYLHPHWANSGAHCPTADAVWPHAVSLPLYAGMTEDEQGQVVEAIRSFKP